jgi:transposase
MARSKLLEFLAGFVPCVVAMEACAGAHHWGRAIMRLRHEVRLIAPSYVKPFVKRQKNDAADAEAICDAAMRPTMIFVAVKSEAKQASAVVFKARDLLVRQRTQIINALRGHMAEFGVIVPQGPSHVEYLLERIENPASDLPEAARGSCLALAATLHSLAEQIEDLDEKSPGARGRTKPPRG